MDIRKDEKGKWQLEQVSLLEKVKECARGVEAKSKAFSIYPMQLALAYEHSPDELKSLSARELAKRLYVVRQVEENRIIFHHQREARRTTEVQKEFGVGASRVDWAHPLPRLRVSKGVFLEHMLYEGVHFTLSMDGKIEWIDD